MENVKVGQRYIYKEFNNIYEVKENYNGKLEFDNGIIHVEVTQDRLNKVELIE